MHFASELLRTLTFDELDDTINWCRTREKHFIRERQYGLGYFWRALAGSVVDEYVRRSLDEMPLADQMVFPDMPGRASPDERR